MHNRMMDLKEKLRDPKLRKKLMIEAILFGQVETGREPNRQLAEEAYESIQKELGR